MLSTGLRRGVAAALVILAACSQSADQRVRVSGDAAQRLLASGGTLLQDYGAFQVVQAAPSAIAALPPGEASVLDDRILLNAGAFDPDEIRGLAARTLALPAKGSTLGLVQFAGPVRPEWHEALVATGVRVVTYIPNDAYLVYGDAAALASLSAMSKSSAFVRWTGAYLASDKLDPSTRTVDTGAWSVQLVEDAEANERTLTAVALVEKKATRVSSELGYVNLVVYCDAAEAASLAALPDVVSIQPWIEPILNDERQAMIVSGNLAGNLPSGPGYLAWLASKGFTQSQFTASDFGVDITDSGIDNATPAAPNHFGLYVAGNVANASRLAYSRLEGTPHAGSTIQGCDGHGTINAHIVGGYAALAGAIHADAAGYRYGMGIAPFVKVGSSVIFDPGSYTSPDFEDLQARAWAAGMRISSNSWGASSNVYSSDSQRYDALVRDAAPASSAVPVAGNQEMTIVFAAGNSGPGANTVGTPGTAKNVITVGGTEGVQPFGAADGCGVTDTDANSASDIVFFSSRGPCADGRRKPDLVAPASHISGGVAQAAGQRADPPAVATGAALGCFDASGVCGGPGAFFPNTQQWYTASSGTSHSTPAVAGAAALVRQWFINSGWGTPSPAMTKAYLMNAARYLAGVGANDTLPSNNQGLGGLDLGMGFDGVTRVLVDQVPADLFTATGQVRTFEGSVADATNPFRVTLAWTDAPGATSGSAWKNDLNLSVTVGGQTYRGNVFSGASSTTGGSADAANNVESVFLPAGLASGPFTITVTAANINSDGVPGNASPIDQDFALVIYGACTTPPPGIPDGVTATATADNRVEVAWNENGSPEYRVYRSTTPGGPYTRIGSVAASPFVDTTVSGGATYYYVIRAAVCAESANSNEASVTATGACTYPPAFAGLTSAASNGTATCGNTLAWSAATPSCGGTLTYEVYRSTVAGFTPGLANRIATGVTGTSFLDELNLQGGSTYRYVVRATETASATQTDANAVERAVLVHGAASLSYVDDFDASRPANAAAYWIASGTAGLANLTNGCHYQSPTWSYRPGGAANAACGGAYPNSASTTLSLGGNGTVAGINGFAIGAGATLRFNRWHNLESGWDGVWLVYSTTSAGGPWTTVGETVSATQPYITAGGYTGTASSAGGARVWTGASGGTNGALPEVTVNLDPLAGQTAWFAWRFTTDSSVNYEGFYLDDVRISAFAACTPFVPPPGPAAAFSVSLPATTGAGVSAPVTVTAVDAVGVAATGYAGTAAVTSSDPQAILPSPITFASGVATTAVELRSLGAQTVTVTDQADPALVGTGSAAVTAGPPSRLAFGVQPAGAVAGVALPAVTVRITDAFGNTTGATDAVTLALGANPGGDTLGGTLTVNAVAGVATFPGLLLTKAAAGYTLTATGGAYEGATSAPFTIAPAAATHLELLQDASDTVAGDAITPAPAVAIRDAYGNLATNSTATVTIALAANPSAGTLSGTLSVPAVGGIATFTDLSLDKVGAGYQLAASSGALTGVTGAGFAISHAVADHLAFVQQPTDAVAGDPLAPAVSVQVLDRFDNLATGYVGNVALGVAVNPSAAILFGTTSETVVSGVATFGDVSLHAAGTYYSLSASSGLLGRATSSSFDVTPGPVAQLLFATQPGGSVAGAPVAGSPSVHLVDAYGNRQPDATDAVTVALASNPGADTLGGTLTVAAVAGAATFTDLVLDRAADGYTLVAAAAGFAAESAGFDVHPAAPAALEFVAAAGATPAGAPLAPVPVVRVRDAYGNTVTSSSATVTMAIGANPSAGTLSGPAAVAAAGGAAAFPGLSIDAMGNGYTLVASGAGLTAATSPAFDVGAGAPAKLALLSQPSTVQAGSALPALVVELRDAWDNRTAATHEVIVGLATAPGTATLGGTRRLAAVAGRATFSDLSLDRAGSGYVLSATVGGLPVAVTNPFDVNAGPVAQLLFVTQPTGSVAGTAIAGPPAVRLLDGFGNPSSATDSVTVALAANPGGGTLGGTLTVNAVAGVATFSDLVLEKAADGYALVASSGSASATSAGFAVTPAAAAALEFVTVPATTPAGAPLSPAPAVRVRDAFGNTVTSSSATVTLSIGTNPASGTLSGTAAVAAVGGIAVFPGLTIGAVGTGYTLTASGSGLTGATSASFDIGVGAPASLAFVAQPTTVRARTTLPTISVEVRDAWGNRTAAATEVILGFATGPGRATLAGTPRLTAVDGRADFSDLSIDVAGTGYALTATAPGLSAAVSDSFEVTAAPSEKTDGGGCGCGGGNAGELALLLALGGLWRAAVVPRRRKAA